MKKVNEMINIVCIVMLVFMVMIITYFTVVNNKEIYETREQRHFERIKEYTYEEIADETAPAGMVKEYIWTISEEMTHKSHMIFLICHHYAEVYMNDELIYSVKASEEVSMTKTIGTHVVNIPLLIQDAGKEMRIRLVPVYEAAADDEVIFYVGPQYQIYAEIIGEEIGRISLGVIAVIVGLIFIVLEIISRRKGKSEKSFLAVGGCMMICGMWAVTDTWSLSMVLQQSSTAIYYFSIAMLLFLGIPFGKYMRNRFGKKKETVWTIGYMAIVLSIVVQIFLQIFQIADIRETLMITHCVILGSALIFTVCAMTDWIRNLRQGKKRDRSYFFICVIGIMADVILFYVRDASENLICSVTAFTIYFALTGIQMFQRYQKQAEELEESRVDIMLGQIRPHFIYNTLGTIRYLCLNNPERAATVVEDFSLYLRGSFGELGKKSVIPLTKEISHVQHYVDIEEVRFPDIAVKFDLKATEFQIPALSIQPLVENSIKHGLKGKGTVCVRSYETETHYCISVEDDGIGFDVKEAVVNDGRRHIGIENIRGRVEAMCEGTLTIESAVGEGTRALIKIPK